MKSKQDRIAVPMNAKKSLPRIKELTNCLAYHESGRFAKAEACYRAVLARDKDNAEALHLLGGLLFQLDRHAEAVQLLMQAINLRNNDGKFYNTLGVALKAMGQIEQAIRFYRNGLELDKDNHELYFNLGHALKIIGDYEGSIEQYHHSLVLHPLWPEAHNSLGIAYQEQGNLDQAIEHYNKAIELRSAFPEAFNNRGTALQAHGNLKEAIESYGQALILQPNYTDALLNMALALDQFGKVNDAIECYIEVLEQRPLCNKTLVTLFKALVTTERYEEIIQRQQQVLVQSPDNFDLLFYLGLAFQSVGRLEEAVDVYSRAIEVYGSSPDIFYNVGIALQSLGRLDDAENKFRQALTLRPDYPDAHYQLAALRPPPLNDPVRHALNTALTSLEYFEPDKAALLHYAQARVLEIDGEYKQALTHYVKGAVLKRSSISYDVDATRSLFNRTTELFNRELFSKCHESESLGRQPIFIVGMPRTGSTLVEQIIATHSEVYAAGELRLLDKTLHSIVRFGTSPYPDFERVLKSGGLGWLGRAYLLGLPTAAGQRRVIDKMPFNFYYLGLIKLILPDARIIHTVRNPVDTCLSYYTTMFAEGNEFSYDLSEVGQYYCWYSDMMAHWRQILPPGFMVEVCYEDVVADVETQARRLLEHCGLSWDARCLEFHKNKRSIKTASLAQVRQPIYTSSVNRWCRYGDGLAPLLNALEPVLAGRENIWATL